MAVKLSSKLILQKPIEKNMPFPRSVLANMFIVTQSPLQKLHKQFSYTKKLDSSNLSFKTMRAKSLKYPIKMHMPTESF